MKIYKKISLLLIFIFVFSLVGCQSSSETVSLGSESSQTADHSETAPTLDRADEKMLVVYFFRTGEQYNVGVIDEGNTAIVAKMIAEKTGADQSILRRRRRINKKEQENLLRYIGSNHSTLRMLYLFFFKKYP